MNDNTFWGRVKMLLKAHKMTQRQFAGRLGIPLSTLTSWIHYNRIPDTSSAYEIAVTLGVTLNYLLGGQERDITVGRLNELAAREAAASIMEFAELILKEAKRMKPIKKQKTVNGQGVRGKG